MMTATQQRDLHGLRARGTGATSGLGRAIAFQLARDGADVTVHGRDAARGVQTVEEIQLQGAARQLYDGSDGGRRRRPTRDLARSLTGCRNWSGVSPDDGRFPVRPSS